MLHYFRCKVRSLGAIHSFCELHTCRRCETKEIHAIFQPIIQCISHFASSDICSIPTE